MFHVQSSIELLYAINHSFIRSFIHTTELDIAILLGLLLAIFRRADTGKPHLFEFVRYGPWTIRGRLCRDKMGL